MHYYKDVNIMKKIFLIGRISLAMACMPTFQSTAHEFLESDAARAIQIGALVGAGMGVLNAPWWRARTYCQLALLKKNLLLVESVDGVTIPSIDLVSRGLFQTKRVTMENKLLIKTILYSELAALEVEEKKSFLSGEIAVIASSIVAGGFAGLLSSFIMSYLKLKNINNRVDITGLLSNNRYNTTEAPFIVSCDNVKKSVFGKTEYKDLLAAFMSLLLVA